MIPRVSRSPAAPSAREIPALPVLAAVRTRRYPPSAAATTDALTPEGLEPVLAWLMARATSLRVSVASTVTGRPPTRNSPAYPRAAVRLATLALATFSRDASWFTFIAKDPGDAPVPAETVKGAVSPVIPVTEVLKVLKRVPSARAAERLFRLCTRDSKSPQAVVFRSISAVRWLRSVTGRDSAWMIWSTRSRKLIPDARPWKVPMGSMARFLRSSRRAAAPS